AQRDRGERGGLDGGECLTDLPGPAADRCVDAQELVHSLAKLVVERLLGRSPFDQPSAGCSRRLSTTMSEEGQQRGRGAPARLRPAGNRAKGSLGVLEREQSLERPLPRGARRKRGETGARGTRRDGQQSEGRRLDENLAARMVAKATRREHGTLETADGFLQPRRVVHVFRV